MKKLIKIYTDGAVSGNPGGPGGAAAIVQNYITEEIYIEGRFSTETTNQRAELMGIIIGLNTVLDLHTIMMNDLIFTSIKIFSDSAYIVRAFNEKWIEKWQYNDWITSTKKSVTNQDLWKSILNKLEILKHYGAIIEFIKVKGHSNNKYNNLADEVAVYCKKNQVIFSNRMALKED